MLSAEHFALENKAVRELLQIREREVTHMTDRLNAIGTQASLIGGFVVTSLTAVTAASPDVAPLARNLFWLSSAFALSTSIHCILNATVKKNIILRLCLIIIINFSLSFTT